MNSVYLFGLWWIASNWGFALLAFVITSDFILNKGVLRFELTEHGDDSCLCELII